MIIDMNVLKAVTKLLDEESSTFDPHTKLVELEREHVAAGIRTDNPECSEDEVQATIDLGIILEALSTGTR